MMGVIPVVILINSIIFGTRYYSNGRFFFMATVIPQVFFLDFIICGHVASL